MGLCIYCGEKAGLLRKQHFECKQKHDNGEKAVWTLALNATADEAALTGAVAEVARLAASSFLPVARVKQLLVAAWEKSAEAALENDLLTQEEEHRLVHFSRAFDLTEEELNVRFWLQRLSVSAALRDLAEGKFPERCHLQGPPPFNLQQKERLAWLFPAICYEERTRTEYEGKSAGVSVRVAKGLYYRTSAFKGRPVITSYMYKVGAGFLGLTDKHIYFHCPEKAFRIAYTKIVAFDPHNDGIGIHQDGVSAKPKVFVTGDGWSVYNLAVNLSQHA